MLPKMVDILDEPIGDPAAINTFLMCQAARERGVKVILSGMGADELFGGYRKHLACHGGQPVSAACRPPSGSPPAPPSAPCRCPSGTAGCAIPAGPSGS